MKKKKRKICKLMKSFSYRKTFSIDFNFHFCKNVITNKKKNKRKILINEKLFDCRHVLADYFVFRSRLEHYVFPHVLGSPGFGLKHNVADVTWPFFKPMCVDLE